ncbi:PAS domain-containing sensor histidine kinase [Gloeothece verrucosa]|uniref:histidine kinase n=1 Tax=Gloeothece verrucosa (strain PCC 7822) TaxID=497965 RepID=E0UJZ1_GLOV7|nr:PAS domain S-box protein [Gloeothece verrucosa]ADN14627.1 multi-sensor signal transduction histidine kinase [Gloeothece verrucosa PCC 7822]
MAKIENNLFELQWMIPDQPLIEIVSQTKQIYIVDADLWLENSPQQLEPLATLQEYLSPLIRQVSPDPIILLTEDRRLGIAALELGITDYWQKQTLKMAVVERSLRLIVKNMQMQQELSSYKEKTAKEPKKEQPTAEFQAAIEANGQIFYHWNSQTNEIIWSGNIEKILGYARDEIVNHLDWWYQLIHPEDQSQFSLLIERIRETREAMALEYRVQRKDGSYILVENRGNFFLDSQDKLVQMLGFIRDITEFKKAEEALEKREKKLRLLMDSLPVCIAYTDAEQRYQFINKNYEYWFGQKKEDIFGKTLEEVIGQKAYKLVKDNVERVLKGESVTYEATLSYQNGGIRHVLGNLIPERGEDEKIKGYYALITDISDRKQIEDKLRYRLVLETAITLVSKELATYENVDLKRILQILGIAVNANRVYLLRFYHNATQASMTHEWCNNSTEPVSEQFKTINLSPSTWWVKKLKQYKGIIHASLDILFATTTAPKNNWFSEQPSGGIAIPIYNKFGKLWGLIGFDSTENNPKVGPEEDGQLLQVVGDIIYRYHERIVTQEKLQASESLYSSIFNHSADAIFLVKVLGNDEFVYETVNPAYEQESGFFLDQIVGKSPREILPINTAIQTEQWYRTCVRLKETLYYQENLELPIGKRIWRTNLVPIADAQGNIVAIQGSSKNITEERKALDEQIRHAKYHRLLAALTIKIRQFLQIEEILETAVSAIQATLNADRVLFLKITSRTTAKVTHESVGYGYCSLLNQVYEDECFLNHYQTRYDFGQIKECSNVASAEFKDCYREFLQKAQIQSYLIFPIIIEQSLAESSTTVLSGLLCVQQCSHPREWTADEIALLRQISEQLSIALKQAQLRQQEIAQKEELARSNQDLEQFAYIVSHDLQEPLGIIASYGQLLKRHCQGQLDAKAEKYINQMLTSVNRMRQQIDDLLAYSRVGTRTKTFQLVDLNWCLRQAIDNLEILIKKNGATININSSLPTLMADGSQLIQLWQNLISNAIKYHGELPPVIDIACQQRGNVWLFSIRDNGIGIEPQYSERIFQIFQRLHTQEEYSGTGIGLAICQRIIQRHGGKIWVQSQLGKGATFYFTIPKPGEIRHDF